MPRLVREQGKSDGLLRFRWKAELVEKWSSIPKDAISLRNIAISVGFFTPSAGDNHFVIAAPHSKSRHTKRWTASAIDRAVNAVAVATTSVLLAPRQI